MRLREDVQYVQILWKEEHIKLMKAWKKGMGGYLYLTLGNERCSEFDDGSGQMEVAVN